MIWCRHRAGGQTTLLWGRVLRHIKRAYVDPLWSLDELPSSYPLSLPDPACFFDSRRQGAGSTQCTGTGDPACLHHSYSSTHFRDGSRDAVQRDPARYDPDSVRTEPMHPGRGRRTCGGGGSGRIFDRTNHHAQRRYAPSGCRRHRVRIAQSARLRHQFGPALRHARQQRQRLQSGLQPEQHLRLRHHGLRHHRWPRLHASAAERSARTRELVADRPRRRQPGTRSE
jgi:hypothetical protein